MYKLLGKTDKVMQEQHGICTNTTCERQCQCPSYITVNAQTIAVGRTMQATFQGRLLQPRRANPACVSRHIHVRININLGNKHTDKLLATELQMYAHERHR